MLLNRNRPLCAVILSLGALSGAAGCQSTTPTTRQEGAPPPRTAIIHATIFDHPDDDAMLFERDRIVAFGTSAALKAQATTTIDAEGGLVLPGFIDPHVHLLKGGLSLTRPKLQGLTTESEVADVVKVWAEAHKDVEWILGRGWAYEIVPQGTSPTRQALDAAVPDRPVCLDAYDGHSMWCNSRALALAYVTAATQNPPGGTIVREADGVTPAGTLLENAKDLVRKKIPPLSREEQLRALEAGALQALRLGVTTVGDISYEDDRGELWRELERQGRLPIRVVVGILLDDDFVAVAEHAASWQSDRVRLGFTKAFIDGVVESKTAVLLSPYADGTPPAAPLREAKSLEDSVVTAHAHGLGVAFHAIGDGAVRLSLDVIAAANARATAQDPPHAPPRIEHIEVLDPRDAPRFAALGVVASMQPYHALPSDDDVPTGPWAENLGAARWPNTFAWRTLEDAGATLAFGSDWPVMSMDPLLGLAVATTRQNARQLPAAGREP